MPDMHNIKKMFDTVVYWGIIPFKTDIWCYQARNGGVLRDCCGRVILSLPSLVCLLILGKIAEDFTFATTIHMYILGRWSRMAGVRCDVVLGTWVLEGGSEDRFCAVARGIAGWTSLHGRSPISV